ncbi:hypothetical protein [Klebsiella quasipneumoniae]|uniref:hypothetical protein n=1 Tax=Klebsiella quasipneumoniae TaxID=1463165 RepID=UPI0027DFE4B0|nr:hypothetical protein [Klebsiella quasipneumoniae]ELT5800448.1 hypothetical protein [Klebsiella variicola]MDQ6443040.1 hypothetical protein [Klebsiella quasipneumoniae]
MTTRISNILTKEQAEQKAITKLESNNHSMRPDMSTYTAYNSVVDVYCNGCGLRVSMKFSNLCDRGRRCNCTPSRAKPIEAKEKKERELKSLHDRWNDNEYMNRVTDVCPNLIPIPQTFIGRTEPMRMFCTLCNTIVDKRVSDALRGMNCRKCFGVGFNSSKKATLYILKILMDDYTIAYKVGITNKTAQERCKYINNSTELNAQVLYEYTDDGDLIQQYESIIKASLPKGGYISKELMRDGHTETFRPGLLGAVVAQMYEIMK